MESPGKTHSCKIVMTAALLLLLLPLADSTASCRRRWCQHRMPHCLNETSALTRWSSQSLQACVLKASSEPDDLVLEWNKQTGVCSLFHYQQVCRTMQASGAVAIGAGAAVQQSQCSVYRALSLASCDASLDAQLVGVWLAGGSSRFSNLVCQSGGGGGSHRLESANLQWTEEGARFDGTSSYALLNDSRFVSSDPSASFTWLMRLKRQPRIQPFLEGFSCSDENTYGPHLWEYISSNQFYFSNSGTGSEAENIRVESQLNVLPANNESWIDIGIVFKPSSSAPATLYFNGSFVESTQLDPFLSDRHSCFYLSVGRRFYDNKYFLKGVVRALAIANASMAEAEIRHFFSLLP